MNTAIRISLAAAVMAVLGGLILVMGRGSSSASPSTAGPPPGQKQDPTVDSRACQECHPAIYEQWWGSQHRLAYVNPDVKLLSDDHKNTNCIPCHAPRPVYELGIDAMPRSRLVNKDQGVSCLTCHLIPSSVTEDRKFKLAGSRDIPEGTCAFEVKRSPKLGTSDFCAGCHNQHETTDQWRATAYAKPGPEFASCLDCHMPKEVFSPTKGVEPRLATDHTSPGSHDVEYIRKALDFSAKLEGDAVQIDITNARAGHHFPTEERSRAVDLRVQFLDEKGASLGYLLTENDERKLVPEKPEKEFWLYRFRDPYRGERGVPRTLLPHGETWSTRIPRAEWAPGAKTMVVHLEYMRRPYEPVPPTHRYTLFREEIKLP